MFECVFVLLWLLLVEDNVVDIFLMEMVLEYFFVYIELFVVCDGLEVLELLEQVKMGGFFFDLILFDFNMFWVDGFELLQVLWVDLYFVYLFVIVLIIFNDFSDVKWVYVL